MTMSRAKNVES